MQLATLTGHTYRVLYLAISPDGQVLDEMCIPFFKVGFRFPFLTCLYSLYYPTRQLLREQEMRRLGSGMSSLRLNLRWATFLRRITLLLPGYMDVFLTWSHTYTTNLNAEHRKWNWIVIFRKNTNPVNLVSFWLISTQQLFVYHIVPSREVTGICH